MAGRETVLIAESRILPSACGGCCCGPVRLDVYRERGGVGTGAGGTPQPAHLSSCRWYNTMRKDLGIVGIRAQPQLKTRLPLISFILLLGSFFATWQHVRPYITYQIQLVRSPLSILISTSKTDNTTIASSYVDMEFYIRPINEVDFAINKTRRKYNSSICNFFDFSVTGFAKCGTTSMRTWISAHNDTRMRLVRKAHENFILL